MTPLQVEVTGSGLVHLRHSERSPALVRANLCQEMPSSVGLASALEMLRSREGIRAALSTPPTGQDKDRVKPD